MRPPTTDPTAGETARAIRLDPEASAPIADPTDPRYGDIPRAAESAARVTRIVDPTDPACGTRRA
jgi:hypothetical protein